jgi:hypothetical protein
MTDAWSELGPVGKTFERLVAERVHARSGRERVRDKHVQTLHPVGHAAGGDTLDLGNLPMPASVVEVGIMSVPIPRCETFVLREPLGHVTHQPAGF